MRTNIPLHYEIKSKNEIHRYSPMEDFQALYDRITYLRQKGIRMKEIAEKAGIAPSVLSAIYTTVFPTYFKNIEQGMSVDEALSAALVWVNNVSKKKFLGSLAALKDVLYTTDFHSPAAVADDDAVSAASMPPLLQQIERNMQQTADRLFNISGTYISYSRSSGSARLKIEPYLIAPAENGRYAEVGHRSAYGATHWGIALMDSFSHLYLVFNENQPPQLTLFHILLELPMYDRPPYLRGLYTCLDYNHSPIARRILLVKHSDSIAREEFLQLEGALKPLEALSEEERKYYDYTCCAEDVIRICRIPSPQMTPDDWVVEKKILALTQADSTAR